jgi:TatD DNase family protein
MCKMINLIMFVDTHCHLDHPSLRLRLHDVLASAGQSKVAKIIVPGVGPEAWDEIAVLAKHHRGIYPAFGLHPMLAGRYGEELCERLAVYAQNAVAIGEIGLDYAIPDVSRERQMTAFRGQLRMAVERGRPVLIHCRKAFQDLLVVLKEEKVERVGGVMHAFSGSTEIAFECIRLGLYLSVSGTVTYRNAVKPVAVVGRVPLENLLIETDSPDMTPEPYRGRDNEPAFLVEIARKVAEIKGIDVEEVAAVTTGNAEMLFGLSHNGGLF